MNDQLLIDFIIPQFRDPRILRAIDSITSHPAADRFRIIVQDGGQEAELQASIRLALRPGDLHVVEPDRGIFDALNKALDKVTAPWIGWIGSDDLLAPGFEPNFLLQASQECAFVSCTTLFFREGQPLATRVYQPVAWQLLRRWGAHVPHFSTFLRSSVLGRKRFDPSLSPFADIFFFLDIEQSHRGDASRTIATYMAEGGASNDSSWGIVRNNARIFHLMARTTNSLHALIFVGVKLAYKIHQRARAVVRPRSLETNHA